jgi:glycosyltransferase involved in cell wall biosynthesis
VLSFIVPAYNEAQHLARTLEAIHTAARRVGEPYEIVVANDASTDATRDIAIAAGALVVDVTHRHIAATRNAGARAATGDTFFFVDADTVISADVVTQALARLGSGVAGGGATVRFDDPVPWQFRPGVRLTIIASRILRLAFGCFIFCTRAAFEAVGGFDETLYASEEIAFSRALKRRGPFVILPATVTTSSRKLRAHSVAEISRAMWQAGRQMLGLARGRGGLDAWYGERRNDPRSPT